MLDGDLCSCGFLDPVGTLQTRSNTVGDSLVLLPSCSVNLARLKAPGTRLSRNKVIVHGSRFGSNLDLYALQVPVKYVSESDGDDKVGLFLPFCASFVTFLVFRPSTSRVGQVSLT